MEEKIIIDDSYIGMRIDKAISIMKEDLSRVAIQRMIENENIKVNNKKVKDFIGEENLEKIILEDNTEIKTSAAFIYYGYTSSTSFLNKYNLCDEKGYIKKFYLSNESNCDEVNFDTAIKMVEVNKEEKSIPVKNVYYDLLNKNKKSFEEYENNENGAFDEVVQRKGKSNVSLLITALQKVLTLEDALTLDEIDKCNETINILKNGELPFLVLKEANKLFKNNVRNNDDLISFYKMFVNMIPNTYYDYSNDKNDKENVQKEIILSELFVK